MTTTLKKITDSLKSLPRSQRLEVADRLYSSAVEDSPEEVEQAWSEEVRRRMEAYRSGKTVVHSEAQVHTRIQKVINETRRRAARRNR